MSTKKALRNSVASKLSGQGDEERRRRSFVIQKKLLTLEAFKKAGCLCSYVSLKEEVDTAAIIDKALEMGKRVLVPLANLEHKELLLYEIKNQKNDLHTGAYGIMEPDPARTMLASPKEVNLVLVPGIVFDKKNERLGRGAGFYDRFLKQMDPKVLKIGLAFSFQVVEKVPTENHDVKLDMVLTD